MTICMQKDDFMNHEKELLAKFIVNFKKGKKITDPIEYAQTCKALVDLYGSPEIVAKKLGIGKETVRILTKILELPSEVKDLISTRRIPLTVAFDIVPLSSAVQIEVAKAVIDLHFKDARRVIRRKSENLTKSADDIRTEVLDELNNREINMALIALPRKICESLKKESKDIPALIGRIVDDWLVEGYPLVNSLSLEKNDLTSLMVKLSRKASMAIARKARNPANLIERIVVTWHACKGSDRID